MCNDNVGTNYYPAPADETTVSRYRAAIAEYEAIIEKHLKRGESIYRGRSSKAEATKVFYWTGTTRKRYLELPRKLKKRIRNYLFQMGMLSRLTKSMDDE